MLLPEGLEFGKPGWWITHALFVLLVFSYGYRKGRTDERKAPRDPRPEVERPARQA